MSIETQIEEVEEKVKSLDSYTAQANNSPRLFVATFSHASRDTEEQMQAKDAVALPGLQEKAAMHAAAERAGLHTQSFDQDDGGTLVVIQKRQAQRTAMSRSKHRRGKPNVRP